MLEDSSTVVAVTVTSSAGGAAGTNVSSSVKMYALAPTISPFVAAIRPTDDTKSY
ncbi:unnamed protein product [Schistosoma curassoni]|uniref:Secreted protein n=1 Tax=Schistosoma curassoni TaxID=6186 RepID=A0A183KJ19_9TREM|nr:unnamed protein product [Schistosoma curassoni]